MIGAPGRDGAEMPVGMMGVAKDRWMTVSPHGDAPEVPVGRVAVPKTGQKNTSPRDNLYLMGPVRFPCAREHMPL